MRQGEVYTINGLRFAVLSGDLHNEGTDALSLCAPIVRQHAGEAAPFAAALHDTDSLTGTVLVAELAPIIPPGGAAPETTLSGVTMIAVKRSLNALFDM